MGRPILSPPWLAKTSTIPRHEYANNLCFSGGGDKLGRHILSQPQQDEASIMCRWLSGWKKTWLVRYFLTLTSENINLILSWIHIPILLFRGWGKTGPAHSFPTLTSESINFVQKLGYLGGEKLGQPILSPPWQDKASTLCRWLSGWRKTWLVRYFLTLTSESFNLEYTYQFCLLGVGEKLGQCPSLSCPLDSLPPEGQANRS